MIAVFGDIDVFFEVKEVASGVGRVGVVVGVGSLGSLWGTRGLGLHVLV